MEIKDVIEARRTIHAFLDEEIGQELISEALELALTAPNHRFTYPFKFIQIGPKVRGKIVALMLDLAKNKSGAPKSEEEALARTQKAEAKILNPAAIVAFVLPRSEDKYKEREDYATIACSIQNFTLFLKSHGWDSKWSTGKFTQHTSTHEMLGLDVSDEEIIGFVFVGHSPKPHVPRKRPALGEVYSTTE